ncbi:uncharacterized protein LOC117781053 [Drosophila innubila]|uniref:uncharacterized protein LOC117781053 n=1 Tax=Drosophila innubila TaxID=198719 RepID=UPI00148CA0E5|nr:uncharacterized protein LOC117781053 [Drosophila innubila]
MKRHNAKAIAAAVAIAAAAATAEGKKKAEPNPKTSLQSASTLYVDVVKNMTKTESSPSVTPPPPKFTILHEDFPALPGTPEDLGVGINAGVPDDWTAMISDDEDDDDVEEEEDDIDNDNEDDDELQSPTPDSVSEQALDAETETDLVPELLVDLASSRESSQSSSESTDHCDNVALVLAASNTDSHFYGIFDKQFLISGVWSRQKSSESQSNSHVPPPPGFEHLKLFGRLRTNRMGVPLGGVTFDMAPPATAATFHPRSARWGHKPNAGGIEGAYGLAGLANNLKAAQLHPERLSQIFGHDVAAMNVDAHFCACEANKLHASFAGPLQGGRCAPHEVNFDVPTYYRRAGGQELIQPKVEQMQAELLFFFFYTYPGDMMQMLAAAELADRGWRFHIYERLWIRPQPDNPHYVRRAQQESGEYNYFNMVHWKILPRHFDLQPEQLERTITKAELRDQYGYHPQMSFF